MMKIFITGGTGFIGGRLAERLAGEGNEVRILVRDRNKAKKYATEKNIILIDGDLFSIDKINEGMKDCGQVYHLAAYAQPWSRDPSLPYKINVTGTKNIIEAAAVNSIAKIVITSTAGILGYSNNGLPVDESGCSADTIHHTLYDKTKDEVESMVSEYCSKGANITLVNPTRVYGPGLISKSNSLTLIIKNYMRGTWRIIPGDGEAIGNYVFIDDVVNGHILAAQKGRSGQRYILGGENLAFNEFFRILGEVSGRRHLLVKMPVSLMKGVSHITKAFSEVFTIPPLITPDWVDKYMHDWIVTSSKAENELGYRITPAREGMAKTIGWLKMNPE